MKTTIKYLNLLKIATALAVLVLESKLAIDEIKQAANQAKKEGK